MHPEPSGEELSVEAATIETHQRCSGSQALGKVGKQCWLVAMVSHQKLLRHEFMTFEETDTNQKGIGPRATGKAGCLRIEKDRARHIETV